MFSFNDHSHKRYNPLADSWVLVSPHRAKRPWLGQEEIPGENTVEYDPKCYLCPRNKRMNGEFNPDYSETFIFPNDFPAVQSVQPTLTLEKGGLEGRLFKAEGVRGEARVICFSPRHNLTMAQMTNLQIQVIIQTWKDELTRLSMLDHVNYVQIFENKGAAMGCSNPHPHGQVWATQDIPQEPSRELTSLKNYRDDHGSCLLCDTVILELEKRERIVCENESFVVLVPYWAVWPFETLVLPKTHVSQITELNALQSSHLADILRRITCRYDNLFKTSFPYSMGLHGSPAHPTSSQESLMHFHLHFYPPLLRSATVKKFLVGFEMLGEAQRDLTAEQAATRLRELSETHYSH